MEKKYINPDTIHVPRGYTHIVALQGGRMLFVSGQVAIDKEGQIVGRGDLKTQARKAAENLVAALKGAGASLADVVKMNTYVVNYKQDDYRTIADMRREFFPKENPPASTHRRGRAGGRRLADRNRGCRRAALVPFQQ